MLEVDIMVDYLIVGLGLSGLSYIEQLETNNKSYVVFENATQKSSRVAGGLYNPVVLKRFTMAWDAPQQLRTAISFYKNVEKRLGRKLITELPVLRRFNSVEEQNTWFEACDRPKLCDFLYSELIQNANQGLDIPYHYGKVRHTGRIDLPLLLSAYEDYLVDKGVLRKESFKYDELILKKDYVVYNDVTYKKVVFAEGYGIKKNPFFNGLPLVGNKGEYLIIKSKELQLKEVIKSSIFIIPLGEDTYKVGATYNHEDKSSEITDKAKEELQKKLDQFIKVPYQIVGQVTGIRPTVRDRRPLVGTHHAYNQIHVLNGLGTRGILIGPTIAKKLYDHIENHVPLDEEINIDRFKNLL
ncbi:FAD-binding oxidoreductase [Aquimarina sp. 2201CG1-2-11]|uniref:NAD(P)/FAD-dependent oxidoreductase n=1 Tax=Aquimarina discodermiae TaxID=3231043 RepID=UPI00346243D0